MTKHQAAPSALARRLAPLGLIALLALAACGDKKPGAGAPAGPGGGMPPPEVAVLAVQPGTVHLTTELPGRLEASRVAQVRARVTGILQKRVFTEGSDVKAGQTLFRIDAAPYEAALQSAQAQLAQAQAQLAQAGSTATRYKPLVAANAVSQQEYDAAVAAEKAAQAQVAAGKAAVRTAGINLGYATVTAPISGRIGRALVTEGALVNQQQDGGTPLAVVQQIDPLYINITQSANLVLQPDGVRAQTEGNLVWCLGMVLHERLPVARSGVAAASFADYPLPRMGDVPPLDVHLIDSSAPRSFAYAFEIRRATGVL